MKSQKHKLLLLPNVLDHHSKQNEFISVVSELLERAGAPLNKSREMKNKIFNTHHPDGEKSQILSILTP